MCNKPYKDLCKIKYHAFHNNQIQFVYAKSAETIQFGWRPKPNNSLENIWSEFALVQSRFAFQFRR